MHSPVQLPTQDYTGLMTMMKWCALLSQKRLNKHDDGIHLDARSQYHKDYDRIVFSSAFRRMGRKTQVHPLANNDHIHTRLTHSIEVGSVGRSLGLIIGEFLKQQGDLPADISPQEIGAIVQAACLAHDIGNPPFGHAGEFAIRHWFNENRQHLAQLNKAQLNDLAIFEGNAQGFRVVSNTENHYNNGGLRLTYATLGTLMKYPWFSDNPIAAQQGKFNFFQSEKTIVNTLASELGLLAIAPNQYARHPLTYLMEAADDICYTILDMEDALELNILRFEEVSGIFNKLAGNKHNHYSDIGENYSARRRITSLRAKAIENLIQQCTHLFITHHAAIMAGDYHSELMKDINGITQTGIAEAKHLTENNIYLNRRKIELEVGSYATLEIILDAFIGAVNELKSAEAISFKSKRILDLMSSNKVDKSLSYYECYLRITDFVAGMTDVHATHMANQLAGRAL